ncbi:hypothetical protein FE257_000766 [Aspergillus nanangensis]|uniref:Major facilitator superfamily (MFS) profile domain-containing protein n=1 Tax=Aspergillus nanangensis TaxID=2582783 RepID=A0AAD4CEI0_ASPNN|nr:hypothetical protein FE257_000766 [Aspergillus nanangensis]
MAQPPSDDYSYGDDDNDHNEKQGVFGILAVLFMGVFISQADTSLILATYGPIASEFNRLKDASWLLSSYILAMCVAQPLYGKLSDIFGRKFMIQVSYALFAGGSAICGICQSLPQLVIARSIQGLGGAGMVCLVSILITGTYSYAPIRDTVLPLTNRADLVPLRDVAAYRSYINIAQTVGRSSGGAIGGYLTQAIGWRWTLSGQGPLTLIAMALVALKLPETRSKHHLEASSLSTALRRVDFAGAALMSGTILSLLLILDMGGDRIAWTSPVIVLLFCPAALCAGGFYLIERSWAKEPIFPLHLLSHYEVLTSYSLLVLQNASQTALMLFIPLYFQVSKGSSPGEAGAYMIPSIVGNTVGSLLTGGFIKRHGVYKLPIVLSSISSGVCFVLLMVWWHGNTPAWQSLFVFPGGLATGMAHSALFVAVAAGVGEEQMAIAGSGLYLSGSIGGVAGLSVASAVFQSQLRGNLQKAVEDIPDGQEIARKALLDINFVRNLTGQVQALVVNAYISSIQRVFLMGLCIADSVGDIRPFNEDVPRNLHGNFVSRLSAWEVPVSRSSSVD